MNFKQNIQTARNRKERLVQRKHIMDLYLRYRFLGCLYLVHCTDRLGAFHDLVRLAFVGEVLSWAELRMGGLGQGGHFLGQVLGGGVTFGLALAFNIGLAALQAAIDQQANVLASGLSVFPVGRGRATSSCGAGLVVVVCFQNGSFELFALSVAGFRWCFGHFLQAGDFSLDISIAYNTLGGFQDGFGFGLSFGISGIVAGANACLDGGDFCAVGIEFLSRQGWDDWHLTTFGYCLAELRGLGQQLREPFAVLVLHQALAWTAVLGGRNISFEAFQMIWFRHGEGRTRQGQDNQDNLHGW